MAAAGIPAAAPREWVTPAEQLERLYKSSPVVAVLAEKGRLPVEEIPELVFEYTNDPCTRWHTALSRISMLPERIPALPGHIHEILDGKCRIHGDESKADGTAYKIGETHSLYLIPPGTLNELEARVSAYGREHLAEYGEKNPLQFRYFWDAARQEHGNTRFDEPQWILISNDVLPGSRNKRYTEQVQSVEELSKKAGVRYEVPSLKEAAAFAFLHKIATGESVLQAGNDQNGHRYTYTRVQETAEGCRLVVGGFAPSGVHVDCNYADAHEPIGVAALRKF